LFWKSVDKSLAVFISNSSRQSLTHWGNWFEIKPQKIIWFCKIFCLHSNKINVVITPFDLISFGLQVILVNLKKTSILLIKIGEFSHFINLDEAFSWVELREININLYEYINHNKWNLHTLKIHFILYSFFLFLYFSKCSSCFEECYKSTYDGRCDSWWKDVLSCQV